MNKLSLKLALLSAFLLGALLTNTKQSFITPAHAFSTDDIGRYQTHEDFYLLDTTNGTVFRRTDKVWKIFTPPVYQ